MPIDQAEHDRKTTEELRTLGYSEEQINTARDEYYAAVQGNQPAKTRARHHTTVKKAAALLLALNEAGFDVARVHLFSMNGEDRDALCAWLVVDGETTEGPLMPTKLEEPVEGFVERYIKYLKN